MSVGFKIVHLKFVYNQTFNIIFLLLHNLNVQNWEYNQYLYRRLFGINMKKRMVTRNLITTYTGSVLQSFQFFYKQYF